MSLNLPVTLPLCQQQNRDKCAKLCDGATFGLREVAQLMSETLDTVESFGCFPYMIFASVFAGVSASRSF